MQTIKKLISAKFDCYIDILDNNSNDKQTRVLQELYKAKFFILLNCPSIEKSDWVKLEVLIAKKRNIHFIVIDMNKNFQNQIKHFLESNNMF